MEVSRFCIFGIFARLRMLALRQATRLAVVATLVAGLGAPAALSPGAVGAAGVGVAIGVLVGAQSVSAQVQATGDPFGEADKKAATITNFIYKMLRYAALIGLAVVIGMGFVGNMNWGSVFYIALGCLVIAIAPNLIDWLAGNNFTNNSIANR